MKFRKKPIVVDAEQFFDPARTRAEVPGVNPPMRGDTRYYVVTAQGQQTFLESGDWVIADGRGYYPCKDSIFREIYESVD